MVDDARPASGRAQPRAALLHALQAQGTVVLVLLDSALVLASFALALLFRYDGSIPDKAWHGFLWFAPMAVLVFVLVYAVTGMYSRIWRFASVLEARQLLLAGWASAVILIAVVLVSDSVGRRVVPLGVAVAGAVVATGLIGCTRFQSRLFAARRRTTEHSGLRVVLVGAGDTGAALVRQMWHSPRTGLTPVALLDDDPAKQGRSFMGVRVLGPSSDLREVARRLGAHQVVLAVPSAPRSLIRQVAASAEAAGVALRVVPEVDDIVRGGLRLQDVRDLRIEDLLGRDQVHTDLEAVRHLLSGRRVLVTGAGGSIGSEIARQVAACDPAELVLLDHDETHLHDVATTLTDIVTLELADIRDAARLDRIFRLRRPEVVFHAAAHKHVPILEDHPDEAVHTNVEGTMNLIAASRRAAVEHFVLISTDKAVAPSSVMGASKRIAEFLTVEAAHESERAYCAVRFGNVLGSRGSVIPTFVRQIESGGPVTITDARMTRYFMSIPEAVQLVLQSAALARGGEVFMLDMGQPVRIIDLAKRMIRLSGRRVGADIEIRVTGVRPGEKLDEQLHCEDELPQETSHPSIVRLNPSLPDRATLSAAVSTFSRLSGDDAQPALRNLLLDFARQPGRWARPEPVEQRMIDLRDGPVAWTPSTI
jgi:FlaA1/EpsC-like NDP-sugar epimerase